MIHYKYPTVFLSQKKDHVTFHFWRLFFFCKRTGKGARVMPRPGNFWRDIACELEGVARPRPIAFRVWRCPPDWGDTSILGQLLTVRFKL